MKPILHQLKNILESKESPSEYIPTKYWEWEWDKIGCVKYNQRKTLFKYIKGEGSKFLNRAWKLSVKKSPNIHYREDDVTISEIVEIADNWIDNNPFKIAATLVVMTILGIIIAII